MARSVALVATLFAAASMLTPAIATNGIGASVDEYSGPPPYTSLPYYAKKAAQEWSNNILDALVEDPEAPDDAPPLDGWQSFSSTHDANSKLGNNWISPGKHKYSKLGQIKTRLLTGDRPSSVATSLFSPRKLKMPKASYFKGNDAQSYAEAKAQTDAHNAHVDEIDAQKAANGFQT